jgi:hypothetical protein
MILTFIVSVVVPFVQEVVDLIEALKGRSTSSSVTIKKVASDFQTDIADVVETVSSKKESKPVSRFLSDWRSKK